MLRFIRYQIKKPGCERVFSLQVIRWQIELQLELHTPSIAARARLDLIVVNIQIPSSPYFIVTTSKVLV